MPSADSSQYTSFIKYNAAAVGNDKLNNGRNYQIVPRVSSSGNVQSFLPSLTIKNESNVPTLPTVNYLTTNVTNASFGSGTEVIFSNKPVTDSSPFTDYDDNNTIVKDKYAHYFNLNGLDTNYTYTFETTAADFPSQSRTDDTVIVLFSSQTKPLLLSQQKAYNDDSGTTLSKLSDKNITGNWSLVVTSFDSLTTGTFTLKITRIPSSPPQVDYCWTVVSNVFSAVGYDVAYGDGKWVAVGQGTDKMYTSSDAVTWSPVSGLFSNRGYGVAYGDGKWVAVGYGGVTMYASFDAVNWSGRLNVFTGTAYGVAYGNGKWVAVGDGGSRMFMSSNAFNWTSVSNVFSETGYGVAYGDGKWVAVGAGTTKMYTSSDAVTWTPVSGLFSRNGNAVAYGNGKWVAVGYDDTINKNNMYTSSDAVNWSPVSNVFTSNGNGVAYANGTWVAVGDGYSGHMYTSSDAVTWTPVSNVFGGFGIGHGIAYGDNKWVAVGAGTTKMYRATDPTCVA